MQIRLTDRFLKAYRSAPPAIQRAFKKQSLLLVRDLHHPSLHAKKYDESKDTWQARVNRDWRFYFRIEGDTYLMIDIMKHPK